MANELKIVATVANEFEAAAVCGLLEEAGIRSMQQLSNSGVGGRGMSGGGARDVYVEAGDFDRARDTLARDEDSEPGEEAPTKVYGENWSDQS